MQTIKMGKSNHLVSGAGIRTKRLRLFVVDFFIPFTYEVGRMGGDYQKPLSDGLLLIIVHSR